MKRTAFNFLERWLVSLQRKPLIIRGARQVGKTWLVRHLADVKQKRLIELNFEKNPEYKNYFASNDPKIILRYLETALQCVIIPEECLLFLDEIQIAPELISKLRWFAETLPELPVIAAGSLLEFTLSNYPYSMPVGRIEYLHIEPLTFEEFLLAVNQIQWVEFLNTVSLKDLIETPRFLHDQLMSLFKDYIFVGGLPAAVASWIESGSLEKVGQIHYNLLMTYRDDFSKYKGKLDISRLEDILMAIPRLLGKKFMYSHVNRDVNAASLKQALELLSKAKLCTPIYATSGNGIPIGSEKKENYFKVILLDVGLTSSLLGLRLHQFLNTSDILIINNGAIAEQITGQILRTLDPPYMEPSLYYWIREEKKSSAEIDYLIQSQMKIIPIEVKAGSSGHLKSLHVFMALKKYNIAYRINSEPASITPIDVYTQIGDTANYQLISLPFYALQQINRFLPGASL